MLYAIIAILSFGVLIATHEAGHMFAAKACGVKVNEYAIGMGPALWSKQKGETKYSLRLFPIGGFCAIEGEDGNSDNPRALCSQSVLKQLFVFSAGVIVNFITGALILFIIYISADALLTTEIVEFKPEFQYQCEDGLMLGDTLYAINGARVYMPSDVSLLLMTTEHGENGKVTFTVERDGELLERTLESSVYHNEDGTEYRAYGFSYGGMTPATLASKLSYTYYNIIDFVRIVGLNLKILVNGDAKLSDFMGPVGIVSHVTEMGETTQEVYGVGSAVSDVMYFMAMIAINLAIMNLLPIPALDGGHIVVLLLDTVFLKLCSRKINRKAINAITVGSFVFVLALMLTITCQDIVRLFL